MRRFINRFLGETKKECSGSAKTAKERLQIVIAKDLSDNTLNGVLIQKIEAEILEVLKKYMDIREENIDIEVSHEDGKEILGLNITFPDDLKKK